MPIVRFGVNWLSFISRAQMLVKWKRTGYVQVVKEQLCVVGAEFVLAHYLFISCGFISVIHNELLRTGLGDTAALPIVFYQLIWSAGIILENLRGIYVINDLHDIGEAARLL